MLSVLRRCSIIPVLLLAACSTSSSTGVEPGDPSTDNPWRAYAEAGPHTVGVTTLTLSGGASVEVWYPASTGEGDTDTYDVRDFTPEAVRNILTGDAPATYTAAASRDAEPESGSYPMVLFSHGFSGMRMQSTFLTSHLASWGMVVAAPDHWSRDLLHTLGGSPVGTAADSVDELLETIDVVSGDERFSGIVDLDRIAAVGHSAGGATVLGAAADDRIDGYVSMASGNLRDADMPDTPSFFIAGAVDQVVSPSSATRPAYDAAPSPSLLWIVEGVGHNGFDDFCTFGNGTGIIGVAEASGLGAILAGNPQLKKLGEDGCIPPAAPVDQAFPVVRHAVTSWLRNLFGIDPEPLGLLDGDTKTDGEFELGLATNEHK